MSQDCRVLALSHESPDFISESCDANLITNLHLQKRRHRSAEQAKSRATAMRMMSQRTRWQRHMTPKVEDDRESACNTPQTKAPAEETTHPTGTVHMAQHISELARCPFLTAPASGSSEGGERRNIADGKSTETRGTREATVPLQRRRLVQRARQRIPETGRRRRR